MRLLPFFSVLFVSGLAAADNRVLVLLENLTVKETHSIYFKSLQEAGLELRHAKLLLTVLFALTEGPS